MRPQQLIIALTFVVALLLVAPALIPPAFTASAAPSSTASSQQKITLLVWDQFAEEPQNSTIEKVYAGFMQAHPNIEIKREIVPYQQLLETAKTALSAGTGPDVVYYDTGPGYAGVLARAGLLRPMDDFAKQLGWTERIFPWARERGSFDGQLYGVSLEMEFLGMFYNKTLLDKEGLKPPQTTQELLQFCADAKAKGYIPIAFGNRPGWQSYHQFGMIANNALGVEGMQKLLFQGEGRWDQPALVEAVKFFFVDMLKAGCFIPDVNSVEYTDANSLFFTGKALTHTTGTWLIGDIDENVGSTYEIAMQPFPGFGDKPRVLPAGLGSAWFVSAKTQHAAEAAQFIDYTISPQSVRLWVEEGGIVPPVEFDPSGWNISALRRFALETIQKGAKGEGVALGYYIDTAVPEQFNSMMQSGFQAVLAGTKTPEQQLADLQKIWEERAQPSS